MPTSTDICFVVLWDTVGYGYDTIFGVFWDEHVALDEIDKQLKLFGKRYVRGDFLVSERKIY